MKFLVESLFWVHLFVKGELQQDDVGKRIARDEILRALAVAEMMDMKSLLDRLTEVRDYVCGAKTDREHALDKLIEAMAIAEALPEVTITLPGEVTSLLIADGMVRRVGIEPA